jgi:hypothetical protein
MIERFINALAENLADIVTIAAVVAIAAGAVLFWRARQRHINQLRARLRGEVKAPSRMREALAKVFNVDVAEFSTIGAVTLVDIAWHYSMADPTIWDHFQGPGADHVADAIQNLDVLKASLGDQSPSILGHIAEYLKQLEASQVFHDLLEHLSVLGSAGDAASATLNAPAVTLIETLTRQAAKTLEGAAKAVAVGESGLIHHIPLVTIGFATYRAWRRSQRGAGLWRNIEFAAIEVTTRAGGGLLGGQVGGTIGTLISPGIGTIVGGVAGAVAGAVGGAVLGEQIKQSHVKQAHKKLEASLNQLGEAYLEDVARFRQLTQVFIEQEREYTHNLLETRRRLRRYAMPWRVVWPDEKLILLQETVAMAQARLSEIKQGTLEAIERLEYMRDQKLHRQMGVLLWNNPALRQQLNCEPELVEAIEHASRRFQSEVTHLGQLQPGSAPA